MWMIAGLPGKLKALMDRLTATRAENLDNLNATITSRAPASTALSNAVWTDARAAKIDTIAAPLDMLVPIANGGNITGTNVRSTAGVVTALSVTGAGLLRTLSTSSSSSYNANVSIVADGVTVFSGPSAGVGQNLGGTMAMPIPFYSTLVVTHEWVSGSASTLTWNYRRVA